MLQLGRQPDNRLVVLLLHDAARRADHTWMETPLQRLEAMIPWYPLS